MLKSVFRRKKEAFGIANFQIMTTFATALCEDMNMRLKRTEETLIIF